MWPLPENQEDSDDGGDAEEAEEEAKEPGWEDQPVKDKLVTALTYLRSQHFYCLHCGCQVGVLSGLKFWPSGIKTSKFSSGRCFFLILMCPCAL